MEFEKIILGIDPGTNFLGYGVIGIHNNQCVQIAMGVVNLGKLQNHGEKLAHIFERISSFIDGFEIHEISIEAPFYGKNIQSMLKLGRAQGVAIAAALHKNKQVFEYEPRKIKQSITGNGNASKQQVAKMCEHILNINLEKETLDATDAIAAALCHYMQKTPKKFGEKKSSKKSGWAKFIEENPDKVK